MEDLKKQQLFEQTPIPRAVAQLAIPTVMSSLVMVLYNLADTYFVGMLNQTVQNAAVTLAAPVLLSFNAVNNLFGVGSSSMMSRALGRKDYETARKSSAFGFYCALCMGLLLSIGVTVFKQPLLGLLGADEKTWDATAGYIFWTTTLGAAPAILNVVMANMVRAEGCALHASIGTMSGCLLNIVLDPIFILPWGLNMGAAGAGCATFLSNCVSCIYFFLLLAAKRGHTYVCIDPRRFRFQRAIAFGIMAVGLPAAVQNLLNVTGMTVLNNFTASFDDTAAVTAMGISQKISMVPMYIAQGIAQGIMPLVSYNYASGNHRRMRRTVLFAGTVSACTLTVACAGLYGFAKPLLWVFMKDVHVVSYGTRFLRGLCLAPPFMCVDFLAVGVFQACGMGGKSFIFAILRKIVLEIPALYLLNRLFPLYGLAYAQPVAEFTLAIAAVVVLITMFKRMKPVTPAE